MLENVRNTLKKHGMIAAGDRVVVGLSGGADSVALLIALLDLREELGIKVFACHVNHGLRDADSDWDELFVQEMCNGFGVSLKVHVADVQAFAEAKKLGIEEAARKLRYAFLENARTRFKAVKIAVGHNLDDTAETVIMNLCRGAGLKGLGGIPPVNGRVVRPLIEVPRAEIEEYLKSREIKFVTDSSNQSSLFTRNRVRNIVIPLLETEISANVKAKIAKNAELLRCDEDFIEMCALEAFNRCAKHSEEKFRKTELDIAKLADLPLAVLRRVIRIAVTCVRKGVLSDVTFAHIELVLGLANAKTGREIHLPGVVITKEYGKLIFFDFSQKLLPQTKHYSYVLAENSKKSFPEIGKTVSLSFSPQYAHCTKVFSYDKITKPLVLRTRQPGDKITFCSSGKMFTKKLQDYFTDEKISKSNRDAVPLIAHGNEILWILDKKSRTNAKFEAKNGEKTDAYFSAKITLVKNLWISVE